ncbi:hypothetical protein BGX23_001064 [Mortierella sp. AD031]|nr:hypothetical protein BGX23_001064 [Mortierella sp. AD031]
MTSASTRFFELPELVALVLPHLNKKSIARLMQTSRLLNAICTPFLYHDLNFYSEFGIDSGILCSAGRIKSFARNVHHVKGISLGPVAASYLYTCFRAYHDELVLNSADSPVAPLPAWFPRLDTFANMDCGKGKGDRIVIVPIPPMIQLSSFSGYIDKNQEDHLMFNLIYLESCMVAQVRQRQNYALVHQSPQLTRLSLDIIIQDLVDIHLLSLSIAQLPQLEQLSLRAEIDDDEWPTPIPAVFSSCPVSLKDLGIRYLHYDFEPMLEWTEEDMFSEGDLEEIRERALPPVQEEDLPPIPIREVPLSNLTTLSISVMAELSLEQIQSIFEHCPEITRLFIPLLDASIDVRTLAQFIGEHCPRLKDIDHNRGRTDNQLALDLLEFLPAHTVEELRIARFNRSWEGLVPLIGRHSRSLRKVEFERCARFINTKNQEDVFGQCPNLKTLELDIDPYTAR